MTSYVALLRAVNVGGRGKLPMAALRAMAEAAGFKRVRSYIASGNLVFESGKSEAAVTAALERSLTAYAGKPVGVLVRTGAAMAAIQMANPFAARPGNFTVAIFLDAPPPPDALVNITGRHDEEIALGAREIYVYYPSGQGRSTLKIAAARHGTARNMNSVATLAEWAGG